MRPTSTRPYWGANFQALSLFRIGFGAYLIGEFFVNDFNYLRDFYGADGILPAWVLVANGKSNFPNFVVPLLTVLEQSPAIALVQTAYPIFLVGLLIGYKTRVCNAVAFAVKAYFSARNPYVLSGAESLSCLLLLWSLFLPLDRYWSVDAALNPDDRERPWPFLPFLAMRLQIASLYVFAALFKLQGGPWRDGSALAWALSDNAYGGTFVGLFLVDRLSPLLYLTTFAISIFQLSFPLLVYCPWYNDATRAFALAGTAAMHIAFIFCLNVGGFPYLCLAMLFLLVPDSWIDALLQGRRARLQRVAIYYEPACGFCERISLLLREFLLSPTAAVLPATADSRAMQLLTEHRSWVIRGSDGSWHLKWRALAYLLKQNPALATFGRLSDMRYFRQAAEKLYDAIGRKRRQLGPVAKTLLPIRRQRTLPRLAVVLCGVLAVLALLGNIGTIVEPWLGKSTALEKLTAWAQVKQRWNLFAPVPTHLRREYRINATLEGGPPIDLMRLLRVPLIQATADGRLVEFPNHRWLKYFSRSEGFSEGDWTALGAYLCRRLKEVSMRPVVIKSVEVGTSVEPLPNTTTGTLTSVHRSFDCGLTM